MVSSPDISDELLSSLSAYLPREGKILDAGCGPGLYAQKLKKINENILGLDLTDIHEKTKNEVSFCLGSITSLPIKSNSIDFIYCLTVLQYIEDDAHAICEFYRILKPKGKLFITVPTRWSPFWLIRETEIYFGVYPWQSSWNIRPYHYYSRSRIGKLTENKFSVLEISGYSYNFFPRLGGLFLNLAKKNRHFNHFFSELLLFRQRNATIQTSSDTPETKVIETKKNQPRKKHISKFSDLSYHYLIVLEKQG